MKESIQSRPTGARGLKCIDILKKMAYYVLSRPTGARGLKFQIFLRF